MTLTWMKRTRVRALLLLVCGVAAFSASPHRAAASACAPTITVPQTLPTAEVNHAYSYQVAGTCLPTPTTWSVSAGTLPGSLAIDHTTGVISGSPGTSVVTAALTIEATNGTTPITKNVTLPVVQTLAVDPGAGELTGATNDGTLAYVAGSTAGKVFDIDPRTSPVSVGTALSGLQFPAAVKAIPGTSFLPGQTPVGGTLAATQFDAPASADAPVETASPPTDTSSPATNENPIGGNGTCAKPDGVTTTSFLSLATETDFTCAGSNQVTQSSLIFAFGGVGPVPAGCQQGGPFVFCEHDNHLGTLGVPSGIDRDSVGDIWVGDARNGTVTEIGSDGIVGATMTLPAGSKPANVAYDVTNGVLYVADAGTDEISQIDTGTGGSTSGTVTPSDLGEIHLPVGSHPYGVAVNGDGTTLVATESGTHTADVIDVSGTTPTLENSPSVGSTPDGVTVLGSQAFVANEVGGTVTIIAAPSSSSSALVAQHLTVTHSRGSVLVHRAAILKARAYARRLTRAAKWARRHHVKLPSLRALHRAFRLLERRHRHAHHAQSALAGAVADPLVAPLPTVR